MKLCALRIEPTLDLQSGTPLQRFYFIGIYRLNLKLTFMFIRIASLLFDKSLTYNDLFYDFSSSFSLGVQVDVLFKWTPCQFLSPPISLFQGKGDTTGGCKCKVYDEKLCSPDCKNCHWIDVFDSLIFQFFIWIFFCWLEGIFFNKNVTFDKLWIFNILWCISKYTCLEFAVFSLPASCTWIISRYFNGILQCILCFLQQTVKSFKDTSWNTA